MYNQQEIAIKIKNVAKERKIPIKILLDKCDLNINYISDLSKGNDTMISNIYKIADYLEVSIDYLLGRSEQPAQTINNQESNKGIQANTYNAGTGEIDETSKELLEQFRKLSLKNKGKIINEICEMAEKENK